MGFDSVADKDGNLEIIVSRYHNKYSTKEVRLVATGFLPFEPLQTEILGEERDQAIIPYQ